MAQLDLANATMYIRDRTSNSMEIKIGEGNLQYTEKRNIEMVLSRGELDTAREADEVPLEANFDFIWEYISSDVDGTIEDALKRTGACSAWVSASTDPNAPYCVNIEIVHAPGGAESACGGDGDAAGGVEHVFLTRFYFENLGHSVKDGTIDCSGKCNATRATTSRSI